MKKFLITFLLAFFVCFTAVQLNSVKAQEDVYEYETASPDTLSIDDMDPTLYSDDDFIAEDEGSNRGVVLTIVIIAVVAGFVIYKVVSGKKK
ncbi:hypothetical protein QA597_10965 [Marinilabiliaceae bacterium ANBcel2]|nr:hypothetical protein [Marinilabiliaceae bacterium ANBcel2]